MEGHEIHHDGPHAGKAKLTGVFDHHRVKYDSGTGDGDIGPGVIDAIVTHVVDDHNLCLAAWVDGVFRQINNGNPVPERAEGGGVTWSR